MANITIKDKNNKILKSFPINIWKKLISQLKDNNIEVNSACNIWICWACMFNIESWKENIIKNFKWEPGFPLWDEELMSCIAWVKNEETNIVLKNIY